MRKAVHGAGLLCVAVAVAGCAFATGSQRPAIVEGARPSAVSAASTGPFGMLAIPAGATPWTSNTDAPMSLEPYIDEFWISSARAGEKSEYAQWGFVSGGIDGWINVDGSQQSIAIARFSTVTGAINAFDELSSALADKPAPCTTFAGPADQAVGSVDPKLDSYGNALVEITARVGDYLVDVHEFAAAIPDPSAAKALFLAQVKALKSHS